MTINRYHKTYSKYLSTLMSLLIILSIQGCLSIKLIASYDQEIDNSVTAFQKKIDSFLIKLQRVAGTPKGNYENYVDFYDEIKADISSIRVRAMALPNNEITIYQIDEIENQINILEKIHKDKITAKEIAPIRSAINISCTAILKLELAKKRGEKASNK